MAQSEEELKEQIDYWSKLYGRPVTEDEYKEIRNNLIEFFRLLAEGNKSMYKERLADIRNKLQPAVTVLEFVKQGKAVPPAMVDAALKGIEKILELIDKDEVA